MLKSPDTVPLQNANIEANFRIERMVEIGLRTSQSLADSQWWNQTRIRLKKLEALSLNCVKSNKSLKVVQITPKGLKKSAKARGELAKKLLRNIGVDAPKFGNEIIRARGWGLWVEIDTHYNPSGWFSLP
jgi:hypothetical protein